MLNHLNKVTGYGVTVIKHKSYSLLKFSNYEQSL